MKNILYPYTDISFLEFANLSNTYFFIIFVLIMGQQQTNIKEKGRVSLKEPRRYKVVIYNDDFTTMDFVVKILTTVFFKSENEAETLMMSVHKSGSAVVGIYSYDIALSKVRKATDMARQEGFPLKLTVLPEDKQA